MTYLQLLNTFPFCVTKLYYYATFVRNSLRICDRTLFEFNICKILE